MNLEILGAIAMACSIYYEYSGSWEKLFNGLSGEKKTYLVVGALGIGVLRMFCPLFFFVQLPKGDFWLKGEINQKLGFCCLRISCHVRTSWL